MEKEQINSYKTLSERESHNVVKKIIIRNKINLLNKSDDLYDFYLNGLVSFITPYMQSLFNGNREDQHRDFQMFPYPVRDLYLDAEVGNRQFFVCPISDSPIDCGLDPMSHSPTFDSPIAEKNERPIVRWLKVLYVKIPATITQERQDRQRSQQQKKRHQQQV